MNRTLIKYLISVFLFGFLCSNNFESELSEIKYLFENSSVIELKMNLEGIEINNVNNDIIDKQFYLMFNLLNDIYQIKYLDNIIYYNREIVFQYNKTSNQLFKYLPDKQIESYLDKQILKDFFNFDNYKIDNSNEGYQYTYANPTLGLDNNIYIESSEKISKVLFLDDVYRIQFDDIKIDSVDLDFFESQLLINYYKNISDIEIFDFTK